MHNARGGIKSKRRAWCVAVCVFFSVLIFLHSVVLSLTIHSKFFGEYICAKKNSIILYTIQWDTTEEPSCSLQMVLSHFDRCARLFLIRQSCTFSVSFRTNLLVYLTEEEKNCVGDSMFVWANLCSKSLMVVVYAVCFFLSTVSLCLFHFSFSTPLCEWARMCIFVLVFISFKNLSRFSLRLSLSLYFFLSSNFAFIFTWNESPLLE